MAKIKSINLHYEFLSSSPKHLYFNAGSEGSNTQQGKVTDESDKLFNILIGRLKYITHHSFKYIDKCILDFRLIKMLSSKGNNTRGILRNFLTFAFKIKVEELDNTPISEIENQLKMHCDSLLTFTLRRDYFDIKEITEKEKEKSNNYYDDITNIIEILRPIDSETKELDVNSKLKFNEFDSSIELPRLANLMLRTESSSIMGYSMMSDVKGGFTQEETKLIIQAGIKEKTDKADIGDNPDQKNDEITQHPICKIRFFSSEDLSDFFRAELYECFGSKKPKRNYLKKGRDKNFNDEIQELRDFELKGDSIIQELQNNANVQLKLDTLMLKVYRSLKNKEIQNLSTIPYKPNIPGLKTKKYNSYTVPITEINEEGITLGTILTDADFRPTEVKIADKDRVKHLYIIGKTGTGKSSLLASMIIQDIAEKKSAIVIDPHGELCDEIISKVSTEFIKDNIILIDPSLSYKYPGCSMNILDIGKSKDQFEFRWKKDYLTSELTTMFISLYGNEVFGPRIQEYFGAACRTLMEPEIKGTLTDVLRLFTDNTYLKECRSKLTDEQAKEFWRIFDETGSREKEEMLPYFSSKFAPLIRSFLISNFVEGKESNLDLEDYIENGKTVLIRLSKGELGELGMSLIGMLLITRIKSIILTRSKIPATERKFFTLYVDEFQNFISKDFQTFLSEARKYELALVLAHQYLGQMEQAQFRLYGSQNLGLLDAIMGNVGSYAIFRIGIKDAETLQPFLGPPITKEDLVNLDNYEFIGRILNKGVLSSPMTVSAYRHLYLYEKIASKIEFEMRIEILMQKFSIND